MKQQNKLKNVWGWVERRREGEERVGGAAHPGVAQQSLYGEPRTNVQPFTPLYITIFDKKGTSFCKQSNPTSSPGLFPQKMPIFWGKSPGDEVESSLSLRTALY